MQRESFHLKIIKIYGSCYSWLLSMLPYTIVIYIKICHQFDARHISQFIFVYEKREKVVILRAHRETELSENSKFVLATFNRPLYFYLNDMRS